MPPARMAGGGRSENERKERHYAIRQEGDEDEREDELSPDERLRDVTTVHSLRQVHEDDQEEADDGGESAPEQVRRQCRVGEIDVGQQPHLQTPGKGSERNEQEGGAARQALFRAFVPDGTEAHEPRQRDDGMQPMEMFH